MRNETQYFQVSVVGFHDLQPNLQLKAIEKGVVPPRGNIGLVPSQEVDFDLKSKVLGKGGDRRFHAKFVDEVLYFPGLVTEH